MYRYFESTYHWNSLIADRIYRDRDYKTDLFIEEVTYCVGLQRENRFSLSAGLAVCVCLLHAKSLYISPAVSYLYLRNTFGPAQRGVSSVPL